MPVTPRLRGAWHFVTGATGVTWCAIGDIDPPTPGREDSGHEWFETSDVATSVCWWIPAGDLPDLADAYRRLLHLREHGPTEVGWPGPLHPPFAVRLR